MIEYLTLEDLLSLAADLGVGPVRDLGLLDAAGLNGVALEAPDDPAFQLVMAVARGEIDHHAVADTLRSWH